MRRLGVSPGPSTAYGPSIATLSIDGFPSSISSRSSRRPPERPGGRTPSSSSACRDRKATPTTRGPALRAKPNLQACIRVERVLLPRGIAKDFPHETRWRRLQCLRPADRGRQHAFAVHAHLDLVRRTETDDVVVELSPQADLDDVLAVDRKVMTNRNTAARTERQVFAHLAILIEQGWNFVGVGHRPDRRNAERETAHLASRRQVAVQQCRRHRQHARHVVEAVLVGIVNRQQRGDVDVEPQQVANGVLVLGPIETMNAAGPAGIHVARGGGVEFGLQPGHERVERRLIRPRTTRRRHRPHSKFQEHLLPHFGLSAHVRHVESVEGEASGAQPLVMTADAVRTENLLIRRQRGQARSGLQSRLRAAGRNAVTPSQPATTSNAIFCRMVF